MFADEVPTREGKLFAGKITKEAAGRWQENMLDIPN
jgi:hypothetical protein